MTADRQKLLTEAKQRASSREKLPLYVAFLLFLGAGFSRYFEMVPDVAIALVCIAGLLISSYFMKVSDQLSKRLDALAALEDGSSSSNGCAESKADVQAASAS